MRACSRGWVWLVMGALNFGLSIRLKENYTTAPLFSTVWDTLRYIKVVCSIDF